MPDVYGDRLAALEQTWQIWGELGASLTDEQWTTASRCPGWDVAALYVHHSYYPQNLSAPLPSFDDPRAQPVTAAEILRTYNVPDGVAHTMAGIVADRAVSGAAEHSKADLLERFSVDAPRAVAQLRRAEATTLVPWPQSEAAVTLAEGLRIVVLEATVHLLDVQRALGEPPHVPPAALEDTARLLAEVAPAVEFVEAATGRSKEIPLPVLR